MIHERYKNKLTDEGWVRELVEEIFDRGYVMLPDFLDDESFAALTKVALERSNQKADQLKGTVAYELAHGDEIMRFYNTVYRIRCEKEGKPFVELDSRKQMLGFPYKDARDGKKTKETQYHYDGAYVNITLGIMMPPKGGELIAFPNLRKGRHPLLEKIFSRMLLHSRFMREFTPHIVARSKPNGLCLFFGDLTFHGVEPIVEGERLIMTINAHW